MKGNTDMNELRQKLLSMNSRFGYMSQSALQPKPEPFFSEKQLAKISNHRKSQDGGSPVMNATASKKLFNLISDPQEMVESQWTERIPQRPQQIFDKHKSCSNIPDSENEDLHIRKYSQLIQLTPQMIPRMTMMTKKLKQFKQLKDTEYNYNQCASIIAKMKCFCLDNSQTCFDFYRCTDLVLLKYMIYLLIQEQNIPYSQHIPDLPNEPIPSSFKNLIKDTIGIVYEIIEEIKKTPQGYQINELNDQLHQIQQRIKQLDFQNHSRAASAILIETNGTITPTQRLQKKNIEFGLKGTQSQKRYNLSEFKLNSNNNQSQKVIQFQIEELSIKNETIAQQNFQIQKLQKDLKKVQQECHQYLLQLQEVTNNIQVATKTIKLQEQQIEQLNTQQTQNEAANRKIKRERDEHLEKLKLVTEECNEIKELFENFQVFFVLIRQIINRCRENMHLCEVKLKQTNEKYQKTII